eukprot:gb/GECG01014529.1/.p1 GENE.gb/GECG01014529.1/~~gb/GECG01014529.1/.p1  ORF type:complete len:629 (+),score=62.02 gb/GECG01014529.1/:1-1887(+)
MGRSEDRNQDDKSEDNKNPMYAGDPQTMPTQPASTSPFVHHDEFPFTHRCWKMCCETGKSNTIFGSRSASIRKSEKCSILCPCEPCTIRSNMTVPWRRVKVSSVYQGAVPPEVARALFFLWLLLLFVVVIGIILASGSGLKLWMWILIAALLAVFVLLLSLLFRETFGEFTGKHLYNTSLLVARIPEQSSKTFLEEARSFMAGIKDETTQETPVADQTFTEKDKLFGIFQLRQDTLFVRGDAGELYINRTPCGIPCLRSKEYHRFRLKDVLWTYGSRSQRKWWVLLPFLVIAIVLLVRATEEPASSQLSLGLGLFFLIAGILAFVFSASSAMTIGLPEKSLLVFSTPKKLPEISNVILSSQIQRDVSQDPVQKEMDGYDLSEQIADLQVYPDHIRHTSTCNWKKNLCCCLCRCCCEGPTKRCMMAICGYSQLSGQFKKRTYIGAVTYGNPKYLVFAGVILLAGLIGTAILLVEADRAVSAVSPQIPWIIFGVSVALAALFIFIWWIKLKLLLSVGLHGTDVLAWSSFGVVDITGVSSTVWFRPKSEECNELVEQIDNLAEGSIRRSVLKEQTISLKNKEQLPSSTWIERMSKEGEFFYESIDTGNTAWDLDSTRDVYSEMSNGKPVEP